MNRAIRVPAAVLAACLWLAGCGGGDTTPREAALAARPADPAMTVQLRVVSSPAQWVSGGDARIELRANEALRDKLVLWLNGSQLAVQWQPVGDVLQAVVTGLQLGDNQLEARHRAGPVHDAITLTNHPITGPMFSGPQQEPFVCNTTQGAVGQQPLVDTTTAPGHKVFGAANQVVGYSRNCSVNTAISYWYRAASGGALKALPPGGARPADMGTTTLADGRTVDFVVRREVGSINRFLYSFAMLAPQGESSQQPNLSLWNGKLLYWFQGGVAIGHSQGSVHGGSMNPDILGQGFAIAHSSGNNTGTHYNLNLAGETAMMTKERFIERYGVPIYTVGLGGSGGAIQQYIIAQNHPGVLDGLLPVQSYPDMVTQTIHVGDCELLEHYMDATDRANPKWRTTKNRSLLVGFNAEDAVTDPLAGTKLALGYSTAPGSTECVKAWRGLTPLSMNPLYGQATNQQHYEPQSAIAAIRWTHYDDLRNVYGVDANGAARVTWDNVGVQYGLGALKRGQITAQEFLRVNWHVGGWKHPSQMVQEGAPFLPPNTAANFDPWSKRNMNLSLDGSAPAPRTHGDAMAMRAAYTSGHVFSGRLDVPAIDHRQYMERELDMHNSHQSFAVRQRVLNRMGHSGNLAVWFTDTVPGVPKASNTMQALAVMDTWLMNLRANPGLSVAQARPAQAADACFNLAGQPIAAGAGVWNGVLDGFSPGACAQAFKLYTSSRIEAGAPLEGGVYRCALKPVELAVLDGTYGAWAPSEADVATLKAMFPAGVCDYSKPDTARP